MSGIPEKIEMQFRADVATSMRKNQFKGYGIVLLLRALRLIFAGFA